MSFGWLQWQLPIQLQSGGRQSLVQCALAELANRPQFLCQIGARDYWNALRLYWDVLSSL
jgi:hypothetical protein